MCAARIPAEVVEGAIRRHRDRVISVVTPPHERVVGRPGWPFAQLPLPHTKRAVVGARATLAERACDVELKLIDREEDPGITNWRPASNERRGGVSKDTVSPSPSLTKPNAAITVAQAVRARAVT